MLLSLGGATYGLFALGWKKDAIAQRPKNKHYTDMALTILLCVKVQCLPSL